MSHVSIFFPFLQLASVLCLSYTPVKGCPEAVKGNLLMLETTGALKALTALTASAQPPPGSHPAPGPWPHVSPQSRREAACSSGNSRLKENLSLKSQRDGKADNGLGVTQKKRKLNPCNCQGGKISFRLWLLLYFLWVCSSRFCPSKT